MDDFAIKVENVSKIFRLPHEKNSSIKTSVVNFYKHKKGYELQKALNNISFEVKKGEFFGIVGRNGSGKSTLLKLLAGIYAPTAGQVQVNGSLTPFIELGVGFNPELTGRENVFLNGALLGFSRKQMQIMYDDIVRFAELERFMDQKLKNYSSGMQVRLAFSIAIRAQSDILALDEVLAVGDEAFQQKCFSVFEKYKADKKTIVLVTHDMGIVERFCDRVLMLQDGKVTKIGSPKTIAHLYSEINKESYAVKKAEQERQKNHTEDIQITVLDAKTKTPKKRFMHNEVALIRLSWEQSGVKHAGVTIMKQSGEYIFGTNTYGGKKILRGASKDIYYAVKLSLGPGEYFLKAGLSGETDKEVLGFVEEGPSIIVEMPEKKIQWGGVAFLPHSWGGKDVKL
jgi:ABC-2 type transport system ATP-binding protein